MVIYTRNWLFDDLRTGGMNPKNRADDRGMGKGLFLFLIATTQH
jgi:hypothetical protein